MNEQRRVETVEEFKLRIAAIIRAKPEQIPVISECRRLFGVRADSVQAVRSLFL
jgi:hypothetical protein